MSRKQFALFIAAVMLASFAALPAQAQSIRTTWSEDGQRLWFQRRNPDNSKDFYIVDVESGSRELAFDKKSVAKAMSERLGQAVEADTLEFDAIAFTDAPHQILLVGRNEHWLLDRKSNRITPQVDEGIPPPEAKLFLPPRPSSGSSESTEFTIQNELQQDVELFWVATDGSHRSYGTIIKGSARTQHTFVGHVWLLKTTLGEVLGCFAATADDHVRLTDMLLANVRRDNNDPKRDRENVDSHEQSPVDHEWSTLVRDDNLWIRRGDDEIQMTSDATASHTFSKVASYRRLIQMGYDAEDSPDSSADVRWSPDGDHFIAFQTPKVEERLVYYIESSPEDQLQPKLHSYPYAKPGDTLPVKSIRLFSVIEQREIPVSNNLFRNPFRLQFHGWSDSGDSFRLLYNQRGHQVLRLLEVTAATGQVRTVIEETSDTFIHYSDPGKSVREALPNGEILWASERSGWNHLYRYDADTGAVINALTAGPWNVKRIEKIDHDDARVWFFAVGVVAGQDPYHEHFCRVDFDGSHFQILTAGDGTHRIEFEQDGKYFLDTYSRVDLAPVTELRESESGRLICELDRDAISRHFPDRRATERFVAKGRDGSTDIWGIIHWPRDFDPQKKYPIVENIYAGPHGQHVPKSFRESFRHQHQLADAGMIVVQIDGMGTAWRSKAFHDVCYKNLRDAGFPDRIAWIRAAAAKYPQMDATRVGIYGGSAGGQNAMAALLWHHDVYKVAVADCGCHDNRMDKIWWNEQWMGWPIDDSYRQSSNTENAHLLEGKLMLVLGELDRNVDPASTTQVVRRLIEHDKDFEFVLVAGVGHGAAETPWASRKRLNFFKRHLAAE